MYILNIFFFFSILGHFIENFFYHNKDSGILCGYWTPLYGIGVIIILLIHSILKKKKIKTITKIILTFLISAITLSLMELLGGFLIEVIFHKTFWDYSNQPLNIGKYTSIIMSIIWGFSSILYLYIIKPISDIIIKKIPKYITYILSILFIIDLIFTFTK